MSASLTYPQPGDTLPVLTVRRKGEWVGFWLTLFGWCISFLRWLRLDWPRLFMTEAHTIFGTTIWVSEDTNRKPLAASKFLHEGIHALQDSTLSFWSYKAMYLLSKRRRLELELQAYAAEVLAGYRKYDSAVIALRSPVYRLNATTVDIEAALTAEVERWLSHGWTRGGLRFLGETARGEHLYEVL